MRSVVILAALAFGVGAAPAHAQDYPSRLIKFFVGAPAGSPPDQVTRLFADVLAQQLKQTVIVENRPGANGLLAVEQVARAAPDGYTFLLATAATFATNPYLYKGGMLAVTGLTPVTKLSINDFVVVASSALGVKTFPELLKEIRSKPGALNASTSSLGSTAHLTAELLKLSGGLDFVIIPYTGGAQSAAALLGGQVQFTIESTSVIRPAVSSGKAIMLASLGAKRSSWLPDLPTVAESGFPEFDVTGWMGLAAPKDTPDAILASVQGALSRGTQLDVVRARLAKVEMYPVVDSREEFTRSLEKERASWERVIKTRGITVQN
jgi:tripartite-type tricarboxylate transporter receptor subunit TctC